MLQHEMRRQQQQLSKYTQQIKSLERQVEEAGQLWAKSSAELNESKQLVNHCELLQQEVAELQAEVKQGINRADEAERTCARLTDLLVTVKERVTAANSRAEHISSVLKEEVASYFEPDPEGESPSKSINLRAASPASKSTTAADADSHDARKAALMGTYARVQGLLQPLVDSPAVSEVLKRVSNEKQTSLVFIKGGMRQLGKQLETHHKFVHQRFYHLFDLSSGLVRELDQVGLF